MNKEKSKFYITTPIYYVNDAPHIGHAYTSIAADCLARFKKAQNYDVYFLTGTDEHGQKVEKSAINKGKSAKEFCDEIAMKFKDLAQFLNISNDYFIRTTDDNHKKIAQRFWQKLKNNGWIYKDIYEGWYALRDEAFYQESELIDGKAPTGAEVSWHKEESYFFKLSAFEEILLKIYQYFPNFIKPDSKRNEVISFVKFGLKDLSISRTSFSWGVKVPDDENHIMYVWLDALTNYISALGYLDAKNYQKFWQSDKEFLALSENSTIDKFDLDYEKSSQIIHIVGKDILRFHTIYWPAFLIAEQFSEERLKEKLSLINSNPRIITEILQILPTQIFAHGWWTNEGQKISKSVGNIIDPYQEINWLKTFKYQEKSGDHRIEQQISEETAIDYFRYFLMREVPFGNDGDYSRKNLINLINSDLANNIGNLVQRCLSMINKNCLSQIPEAKLILGYKDQMIVSTIDLVINFTNNLNFSQALQQIIHIANLTNKYFNDNAPWLLYKESKIKEMNEILFNSAENIRIIAILLLPFIPNLANKILNLFNLSQEKGNINFIDKQIELGQKINMAQIIMPSLRI